MAAVTTDEGEKSVVEMCRAGGGGTWKMALVKSAGFTLDEDSVYADLAAVEADFPGYAKQTITWAAAGIVTHKGQIAAPAVTFTRSDTDTPQTVYSWVVVLIGGPFGNTMMWGGVFSTPPVFENLGDALSLTPYFNANQV